MKTALLLSSFVLMMAMALTASAGESKGPPGEGGAQGGSTPIDGFWAGNGAASICSFSGLNDVIEEEEPTQTQSYGTFLRLVMVVYGVDAQVAKAMLPDPSHECNPTRAPWGNPRK